MAENFLTSENAIYRQWNEEWRRNEKLSAGGRLVLDELVPFKYEQAGQGQHKARQQQATYLNFMDQAARGLTGHLMRNAPAADTGLSFGTLGTVARPEGQDGPTDAELVFYNVDGVGSDGSQWNPWWIALMRRAMHTGHRWVLAEGPAEPATTRAEVLAGRRPWLREFSPLAVRDWYYEDGRLQFAIIRIPHRRPRREGAEIKGHRNPGYLLLVRQGFDGLGSKYEEGGWWKFTPTLELDTEGDLRALGGDIPLFPCFYERWEGTEDIPAISRPGTTELGQVGVSYMNMASAARFDAWDAASSLTFLLGVNPTQYETVVEKMKQGSLVIPVPPNEQGEAPQVWDGSTGAVTADVMRTQLESIRSEAAELALTMATSAPESSGESKRAGFGEQKAPRLSDMAQNMEQAQNTAIRFLELRFGNDTPEGSVRWPRDFDLAELVDDMEAHMELERTSGLRSKRVGVKAMVQSAVERRIIESDDDLEAARDEYGAAFDAREVNEQRADRLGADLGIGGF